MPPLTDDKIAELTARVVRRLKNIARRHLGNDEDAASFDDPDECLVRSCAAEALRSPFASQPPAHATACTRADKPLTAGFAGFSLHAARVVPVDRRQELEMLCRYGLRAPFALERFSLLDDGRVRYELPKPTARQNRTLPATPSRFCDDSSPCPLPFK